MVLRCTLRGLVLRETHYAKLWRHVRALSNRLLALVDRRLLGQNLWLAVANT